MTDLDLVWKEVERQTGESKATLLARSEALLKEARERDYLVDETARLLAACTQGEWKLGEHAGEDKWWVYSGHYLNVLADDVSEADAALIVAAPRLLTALLTRLKRAEGVR